jgi:nucleotide-binding universal stress UspA family protein
MYRHILIATDGPDFAEHAFTDGLSLAESVGAKATATMVIELRLGSQPFMQPWSLKELGNYNEQMK